ncbi:hypothetical protein M3D71_010480 [Micrococcus luteus]|nr:hypothetical protein [Micrococcus luteus]MCV7521246.1 hypothetical protein [Micrococcus luteus]MCV7572173.1 hypothetical protein [Micrococcus luteus]
MTITTAADVFALLPSDPKERRARAAVVYRCQSKGCVLAEVYQAPGFTLIHQPEYYVSTKLDASTSTPAAREKRTDGKGTWEAQTYYASEAMNPVFYCRHVFHLTIPQERLERDARRGAGVVRLSKEDAR